MNKLKICVLSASDDRLGAYLAGWRLTNVLMGLGHDAQMRVANKKTDSSWVVECGKFGFWINRFARKVGEWFILGKNQPDYYFDFIGARFAIRSFSWKRDIPLGMDAFVITWMRDFLSAPLLYKIGAYTGSPIIWYLMDMSPLTGGCHYSWGCDGYMRGCERCPALSSSVDRGWAWRTLEKKNAVIQAMNLTIVAPTRKLAEQAKSSKLFKNIRVECIHLSVDPEVFKPDLRNVARALFDIPLDKKVIFFGANHIQERRKGWAYLVDALRILRDVELGHVQIQDVLVMVAGATDVSDQIRENFDCVYIGSLRDDATLAAAYQAADMFVCPSIEDAGPMMINEAVMCGTPVVSFDIGVASDLVITGVTGYRAENENSSGLAKGMGKILNMSQSEFQNVSRNCRNLALELCHPEVHARKFAELVESLKIAAVSKQVSLK